MKDDALKPVRKPPGLYLAKYVSPPGSLVLISVALGFFVHPALFGIAAFIGLGLVYSGVSGTCGMALFLQRAPWNQASHHHEEHIQRIKDRLDNLTS